MARDTTGFGRILAARYKGRSRSARRIEHGNPRQDYIEERKDVMMGKPVFKGTRLTVDHVLKEMGTGMTDQELLENYQTLRLEHNRAALLYAAALV